MMVVDRLVNSVPSQEVTYPKAKAVGKTSFRNPGGMEGTLSPIIMEVENSTK